MSYPTDAQLTDWARTLDGTNWADLAHRLTVAINRDTRGGSVQADGYPSSTRPGGSRGDAELTPTEASASARMAGRRDEHHQRTVTASAALGRAMAALGALVGQLDRIEARTVVVEDGSDEGWCLSCIRDGGYLEPVRLGRYARYCGWCGAFCSEHGADPPLELIRARHSGRRLSTAQVDRALARMTRGAA